LKVLPRLGESGRAQLLHLITSTEPLNDELDDTLATVIASEARSGLRRRTFIMLPHRVAREVLAAWLRQNGIREFDRRGLERLTIALKTLPAGKRIDVTKGHFIKIGQVLALEHLER
jgi:hypothetical protein